VLSLSIQSNHRFRRVADPSDLILPYVAPDPGDENAHRYGGRSYSSTTPGVGMFLDALPPNESFRGTNHLVRTTAIFGVFPYNYDCRAENDLFGSAKIIYMSAALQLLSGASARALLTGSR
jgi:hypothetical protein